MPTQEQFAVWFSATFARRNTFKPDPAWVSWAYHAFREGYWRGQSDFAKNHDWYE